MDTLFKNLPRELQWEILTVFVGTHVVRYNKLRRKFTGDIQNQLIESTKNSYFEYRGCCLKQYPCYYGDGKMPWYWTRTFSPDIYSLTQVALGVEGNVISLFKNVRTGELSYGFYSRAHKWYIFPIVDNVRLSPYVKRHYLSYPFTNKKLNRMDMNVVLY